MYFCKLYCGVTLFALFVLFSLIKSSESRIFQIRRWQEASGLYFYALDFVGLVEQMGRKSEEYTVITEDGYILQLFRIPPNSLLPHKKQQVPVYFQHPFLCSADVFVLRGPDLSLPIVLSDAGYDVWLGNSRGTTYGRRHLKLSPDDSEFWDFSLDDLALKDLPANIDFVLQATNSTTLSLIGMSMGTVTPKIMLAEKPEYNSKVNVFINLASVAFLISQSSAYKFIYILYQTFFWLIPRDKPFEIFPQNEFAYFFVKYFCLSNDHFKESCLWLMGTIIGEDNDQSLEPSDSIIASLYLPAGTSSKICFHFLQFILTGEFKYYDYENEGLNLKHYNETTPPNYNISNIKAPLVLFHGDNDPFSTRENDIAFISRLPASTPLIYEVVEWKKFNHFDFISAKDIDVLLFDKVLRILDDFTNTEELNQNYV